MSEVVARPRRSYSRLDTYLTCPQMYLWKYVHRVPEQPSVWSIGGTAFHTVAEQYLRGDLGPEPTDDVLYVAWMEAWYTARDEQVEKGASPDLSTWRAANRGSEGPAWWMEQGYEMVRRFARFMRSTGQYLTVLDDDGPWLERELHVEFDGVPVIAIPDAVVVDEHGQLCIVDYKTGKPPKKNLQLRVYADAIKAATGMDVTWGLYYMARPGQLLANDLTRRDPLEVTNLFADFDARERNGEYPPTPGDACKFCPYKREHCSYYNPEPT